MDDVEERRARNAVRWASMLVDRLLDLPPGDPDAMHVAEDLDAVRREVVELHAVHPDAPWSATAQRLVVTACGRAVAVLRAQHGVSDDDLAARGVLGLVERP